MCDLAGGIQTPEAHEVIMKLLNFDADEDLENSERYLWALSVGSHPDEYVIKGNYQIRLKILQNRASKVHIFSLKKFKVGRTLRKLCKKLSKAKFSQRMSWSLYKIRCPGRKNLKM